MDFVIREGTRISQLIQVCWSAEQFRTRDREIHSLLKASRDLECNRLVVITNHEERLEKVSWFGLEGEVEFIPARKWLLR